MLKSDDPEWFFFCPLEYKYPKSKKFNRSTTFGHWKATGNECAIKGTNDRVIATKKTLVYYLKGTGNEPDVKTDWVIHEYHDAIVTFDDDDDDDTKVCFVIARF